METARKKRKKPKTRTENESAAMRGWIQNKKKQKPKAATKKMQTAWRTVRSAMQRPRDQQNQQTLAKTCTIFLERNYSQKKWMPSSWCAYSHWFCLATHLQRSANWSAGDRIAYVFPDSRTRLLFYLNKTRLKVVSTRGFIVATHHDSRWILSVVERKVLGFRRRI